MAYLFRRKQTVSREPATRVDQLTAGEETLLYCFPSHLFTTIWHAATTLQISPPPNVSLEQILVETLNNGANHSAGRIERLSKPCEGVATVFNVYAREEQRYAHIISTPFRTAVPFWGQFTYNLSTLSPHIYGTAVLKGLRGDHP